MIRVLITCGPTWTPIDSVRVISNQSTGEMGHVLAQTFLKRKVAVTLIEGPVTHAWEQGGVKVLKYKFFDELKNLLRTEACKGYDFIIHAAAVSDFKLKSPLKGKISSRKSLTLNLVPAEKIIASIKRWVPRTKLIGFKLEPALTSINVRRQTKELFEHDGCDLVVANTSRGLYKALIVDSTGKIVAQAATKKQVAEALVKIAATLQH